MMGFFKKLILASFVFATLLSITAGAAEIQASENLGVSWLRDLNSPAVRSWVANQNKKTRDFVSLDSKGHPDALYAELTARAKELVPSNASTPVMTAFGKLIQKAGGLVLIDAAGGESVIAPKIVEADGSGARAIVEFKESPDLKKVAVAYVKNGSDLNEWYVYDLALKTQLAGPMLVRLTGLGWAEDSNGVYYTQSASPVEFEKGIRYTQNVFHDLTTGKEEIVFSPPQNEARELYIVEDRMINGERVLFAARKQAVAEIPFGIYMGRRRIADFTKGEFQVGNFAWQAIKTGNRDVLGKLIGINGTRLMLRTSELGDGFGIEEIDVAGLLNGGHSKRETILRAKKGHVLIVAQAAGDKLLLQYFSKKDFTWRIEVRKMNGAKLKSFKLSDVGLQNVGQLSPFTVSLASNEAFVVYEDFKTPKTTLRLDLVGLKLEALPSAKPMPFDASRVRYEMSRVKSFDGTMVPVSLYTRTDIAKPKFGYVFYYGYIGIAHFGWWNRKIQMVLDLGGAVLMVHHRGGGELGTKWQVSVKADRMPSYEDTVAATRWFKQKTGATKVVASGRSFGGMHTMGLMTHFSNEFDLYAPVVSVADVNEFLDRGLFGYFAVDDFGIERAADGSFLDTPQWRERLAAWSPLANLDKMQALKPTIIFAADTDERTGPEQSYYMVEALNKKYPGNNLVYFYEEKQNGHNARTELVDELAFIAKHFGISNLEPLK